VDDADQRAHRHADHRHSDTGGLKIAGSDLKGIQDIGADIESLLSTVRGTRTVLSRSGTADGYFLDFKWEPAEQTGTVWHQRG